MGKMPASHRRAWYRRLPDETGGTVSIEFAVLLPVFLALLFGVIGFGMQYSARIALTYAAAEGGRAAIGGLDDDERQSLAISAVHRALDSLSPLINPNKAGVDVTFSNDADGEMVTVSIAYSDNRFAHLPFVPSLDDQAPVKVSYLVADPLE
jgi:Flp pilus assembly protein TadG